MDDLQKQMEKRAKDYLTKKSTLEREAREIRYTETIMLGWIAAAPASTPESIAAMAEPALAAAKSLCDACDAMWMVANE